MHMHPHPNANTMHANTHTHMYMQIHTHTHMYMQIHTHTHMYMQIHTHTHVHANTHTHTCTCKYTHTSQQFRALIPGPREHVISTGRACFRVTRAISIRNREWTDFIRLISRSRKLICTRTDEFGLIIARVRPILNETGQTPYEDRVLVRKNYCMTYWQLEDTWLIYGLCQLIPCTEYVAGY